MKAQMAKVLVFIFLITTLFIGTAHAAKKDGIIVWKLGVKSGVTEKDVDLISGFVTTEVEKYSGNRVISESEIQTILKGEETRQACGDDDTSCIAEIGNAMGVPEAVSGDVGKLGSYWMLNLSRINIREVKVIKRASRQIEGSIDALVREVPNVVAELWGKKAEPVAAKPEPLRPSRPDLPKRPAAGDLLEEGPLVIAVMPFRNQTKKEEIEWLGVGVAESLSVKLAGLRKFAVVERTNLAAALKEIELGQTGVIEEDQAPQLGKMLGAKTIILGSFAALEVKGKFKVRFQTRIVSTETGEILSGSAARASGGLDDIFELEEQIAMAIVQSIGVKLSEFERKQLAKPFSNSLIAYEFYSQSLVESNIDTRKRLIEKALEHDPNFVQAHNAMAYIYYQKSALTGGSQEFIKHIRLLLDLDPNLPSPHYLLASYLDRRLKKAKKTDKTRKKAVAAVKQYKTYIDLVQDSPMPLIQTQVKRAQERIGKLTKQFEL